MKQLFFIGLLVSLFTSRIFCQQQTRLATPSPQQLEFQNLELGVFIHYSIDAYATTGISGATPASSFNPEELNVEQWVMAAKSMGAKFVVLTARHEQGFCLWPTNSADSGYSIKYSPYKNGKGDIVKEFVDACRKHGLKPGLYTAPWIDAHWESQQSKIKFGDWGSITKLDDTATYSLALKKEKEQFHELLTNYGPLVFIWNDHFGRSDALNGRHGGQLRKFYATLTQYGHELQPNCLFLGRDIEHVGNESAVSCYPMWNSLNTVDGTTYSVSDTYWWEKDNTGEPFGKFYRPHIACTTDAFSSGGWMFSGPRTITSLQTRMQAYYQTVGRGAVLIVNLTPDKRGLIPENLSEAAKEFGDEIKKEFGTPIIQSELLDTVQEINLERPSEIDRIVLMENIADGQKIAKYQIEAKIGGTWQVITQGKTIGHKRIELFKPLLVSAIRFK
ncbi:MAG TPA: alpha-L-fucosidase, partial [Bacteroidales bacterium]